MRRKEVFIMGWTGCHATHYKNRKVDRKAECDAMFNCDMVDNKGKFEVLKSSMVGSTYYAAVKITEYAEPERAKVVAVVCLTSTNSKDYFNFSYKDMDETENPFRYDCPKRNLDLLTPTENEYAIEWRKQCYENLKKKNNLKSLGKLPIGSVIQFELENNTALNKAGSIITLEKTNAWSDKAYWLQSGHIKWTAALINRMTNGNYEVVGVRTHCE